MSESGRLLLVRHGHTAGNKSRYVGWEDVPLDETGMRQARSLAVALAAERIDSVYSSPLRRAYDTARPLAQPRELTVEVAAGLKEIHFGDYQGVSKSQQMMRLRHDHLIEPIPGGESLYEVYRRIEPIAAEFAQAMTRGRHLAAIGHYWSNRMLAAVLQRIPFEAVFDKRDYKPRNASALEIRLDANRDKTHLRWLVAGGDDMERLQPYRS